MAVRIGVACSGRGSFILIRALDIAHFVNLVSGLEFLVIVILDVVREKICQSRCLATFLFFIVLFLFVFFFVVVYLVVVVFFIVRGWSTFVSLNARALALVLILILFFVFLVLFFQFIIILFVVIGSYRDSNCLALACSNRRAVFLILEVRVALGTNILFDIVE